MQVLSPWREELGTPASEGSVLVTAKATAALAGSAHTGTESAKCHSCACQQVDTASSAACERCRQAPSTRDKQLRSVHANDRGLQRRCCLRQ